MGKREPQTILKTDERSIHLELGRERTFNRQINRLGGKPGFLESDKLEVAVKNGRRVLTHLRAGSRPAAELLRRLFRTTETASQR